MDKPVRALKDEIRHAMKAKLTALEPMEYRRLNTLIRQQFLQLPIVRYSRRIMLYYSINYEVETVSIIQELLNQGKEIALPACAPRKNLLVGRIKDIKELVKGKFGLWEPSLAGPTIDPSDLDLIIVPGLAFDCQGFRLGYGAGYYDRFLIKTSALKIGLAYDFQIIPSLPVESFDIPVDTVLTPLQYLECLRKGTRR